MVRDLVVGSGAVGGRVASRLAALDHQVQVVSRSGTGPVDPAIELIAADASDPTSLAGAVAAPDVIYNCTAAPYHRWATDLPPIAASLADLAERHGAGLVILSNLYGYGPVTGPVTPDLPLATTGAKGGVRRDIWTDALVRARGGRLRVAEVRPSDFYGPGLGDTSPLGRIIDRLLAGRPAKVIGGLDHAHSWAYIDDVAATVVAVGGDDRAWGRPWLVPCDAPLSQRALAERLCSLAGAPAPRLSVIGSAALTIGGVFSSQAREVKEVTYQFSAPFVVDASATSETFGVSATPVDTGLRAILDARAEGVTRAT